jgi:ABC-type proline/glycine betaine transport system permease subunit
LFWIGLVARFSGADSVIQTLSNALPSVAILGMVVGIAAAVLDVYEEQFLLPLLGFGVNVVFLAIFLRVLLQLVGWTETRLDSVRFLALAGLLSVALGLVLMAQALV